MQCVLAVSVLFSLLAGIEAQPEEICADSIKPPEYTCSRSSAPRDGFSFCTTGGDFIDHHILPPNWRVIFDSFNYFSLFNVDGGKWLTASLDGNSNVGWRRRGGTCEKTFYTCTSKQNEQNWAFSQSICLKGAKEVLVNVSYSFASCHDENRDCKDAFVTLYSTQRDSALTSSQRRDPGNYVPLVNSVLEHPKEIKSQIKDTLRIPRDEESSRLYMAMEDPGTCGEISRMILYYTVCKQHQIGLVTYPEISSPPKGVTETFSAICACNAHPVTSMDVEASSDGTCQDVAAGGARCECNAGYILSDSGSECIACPAGTYRASEDSSLSCKPCPANTQTDATAAPFCKCLPGFFRDDVPNPREGPEDPCQAPPGPPVDLKMDSRTDSTITLSWIHMPFVSYNVCSFNAFDVSEEVCFVSAIQEVRDGRSILTISGLQASSSYFIEVESINAVSDQDPENRVKRIESVFESTTEGVPDQPVLKRLCTVVIWKPPPNPKGYITSYELCFGTCSNTTKCYNLSSTENFMLTTGDQRIQNTGVQIRASNSLFTGPFTECDTIGCSEFTGCSTEPPQTTPTTIPTTPTTIPTTPTTLPTTAAPTTTPTTPPTTAAPTTTPTTLPTTAAPTTTPTTPPTTSAPSQTTLPACQGPSLVLNSEEITTTNGSIITMSRIGMEEAALHCSTTYQDCCKGALPKGEWYRVSGNGSLSTLPRKGDDLPLYRNRGDQIVRLNLRSINSSNEGHYRCCIPDSCGDTQCIDTIIVTEAPQTTPTTPPTTAAPTHPSCQGPSLVLNSEEIATTNGSEISMNRIGMEGAALHCSTTYQDCCKGANPKGEWYRVGGDGSLSTLPRKGDNLPLYRNRGNQIVRLNLRSTDSSNEGHYRCCIPDSCGDTQCIDTTIV